MTDTELVEACVHSINLTFNLGITHPVVVLIVKGKRRTFAGKGSPRGQILETRKTETVLSFGAFDVLAYLVAKKRIKIVPPLFVDPPAPASPPHQARLEGMEI